MKTSAISKENEKVRRTESVGDPLYVETRTGPGIFWTHGSLWELWSQWKYGPHLFVSAHVHLSGNLRCSADSQKDFDSKQALEYYLLIPQKGPAGERAHLGEWGWQEAGHPRQQNGSSMTVLVTVTASLYRAWTHLHQSCPQTWYKQ